MDCRPIGVFDSGMGGISTLRQAMALLPKEDFRYYGDNRNVPYGAKSEQEIRTLTLEAAVKLMESGVKALLIACNTAAVASIDMLLNTLPLPVIGIEPAIHRAEKEAAGDGLILMLATEATVRLPRYRRLRARLARPERVMDIGCPAEIVRRVERGGLTGHEDTLHAVLRPYEGQRVDAIVLGCTHYPFIAEEIRQYARAHFQNEPMLFEGGGEASASLRDTLIARDLLWPVGEKRERKVEFMTSGDHAALHPIFQTLMRAPLHNGTLGG